MKNFSDMNLSPEIQKALASLGFTTPTEIQQQAIPLLTENACQDVHAQAQTGTGKTLAFGIPLLQSIDVSSKKVQGLVMAPTRELVLQIYDHLKDVAKYTKISIEPIYGGMPIQRQIEKIRHGAQIIIGTPGRLNDHLRRKTLSLKDLKTFVLDEADIMLDMGFKEEIDEILTHAPKDRQIWLFSATVLSGIRDLISTHMHDVQLLKATQKNTIISTQVKQYYCIIPGRKRIEAAARFVEAAPNFYGIIFCQTKMLTAEVMEQLASRGFRVNCLHGDMKQGLRNQVIKGFKNKDFTILVATDVAARGIDVSDLTHVINFSLPEERENYIHRIGRTGRAGKEGIAITLIAPGEMRRITRLEQVTKVPLQEIAIPSREIIINAKLSAISDFIEQAKKTDKTSPAYEALKGLIESFSDEEIKHSLVATLQEKFFKGMANEDIQTVRPETVRMSQEICVELGSEHGMTERDMRDYLSRTCAITPQEMHKVRVLKQKTFIAIPENKLEACFQAMQKSPIVRQAHKMYLVEDVFRQQRPPRRDYDDRRSPDRSRYRSDDRSESRHRPRKRMR